MSHRLALVANTMLLEQRRLRDLKGISESGLCKDLPSGFTVLANVAGLRPVVVNAASFSSSSWGVPVLGLT